MRYVYLLPFVLFSCDSTLKESHVEKTEELSIDEKIIETYRDTRIVFNDSLQRNDTVSFYAGTINATADFTGDNVLDFFVIEQYLGGPSLGHIHDGKTGTEITLEPDHATIISRPGIDIKPIIVDVNIDDDRKELMVLCGGGGTMENRHYLEIYRFDKVKNKMKLIFSHNISLFTWDDNFKEQLVEVNDISALTSPYPIDNEITVSEGTFTDTIQPYSLNIIGQLISPSKTYTFDNNENMFIWTAETIIR